MGNPKLKGKDLRKINYANNLAISMAVSIAAKHFKHQSKQAQLDQFKEVLDRPDAYRNHAFLAPLAELLAPKNVDENVLLKSQNTHTVSNQPKPYAVVGRPFIDGAAINQMDQAMQLPVAKKGALMPDCHVGYGLPIGGVLATENQVIPYAVGLDIGCSMALTIFEQPYGAYTNKLYELKKHLKAHTVFGTGEKNDRRATHAVLDNKAFNEVPILRRLQQKAAWQLGTSGAGNHFVEFGKVVLPANNSLDLPKGEYLGLMSHSGSRGLGATVAQYFTKVATNRCRLPKGYQHLAWLDLDSAEGQEYWIAMQLAGEYAQACHEEIHSRLALAAGLHPLETIFNKHNFAWKECINGQDLVVHRKGATPAFKNQLGIIPGSMLSAAYVVSGLGNQDTLCSASHGAGRKLSRTKARSQSTLSDLRKRVKSAGGLLIGGSAEEDPIAYKNINEVIGAQKNQVEVVCEFTPRVIRMDR